MYSGHYAFLAALPRRLDSLCPGAWRHLELLDCGRVASWVPSLPVSLICIASTYNACARFFPYYPAESQSSIQRHWADFRPVIDVDLSTLVCNHPGTYAEEYATVAAGAEIEAYYKGWPHDIGPIIVWMAYCGPKPTSCSSFNGTGRHYFKIGQAGLLSGTIHEGMWAQKQMIANNFTWSVTIPERLKGGAYLIRHELIALHVPFTPEFYPECAHLYVVGSGKEVPGDEYLASIPGVWKKDGKSSGLLVARVACLSCEHAC